MVEQLDFPIDQDKIKRFCEHWKIQELYLFGSVLRDDFGPDSDVDFLVAFDNSAHWTLFDVAQMEAELEKIVGRPVDLVSKRAIEQSQNWKRRERILGSTYPLLVTKSERVAHELAR